MSSMIGPGAIGIDADTAQANWPCTNLPG
jgi:hypothetical protein